MVLLGILITVFLGGMPVYGAGNKQAKQKPGPQEALKDSKSWK